MIYYIFYQCRMGYLVFLFDRLKKRGKIKRKRKQMNSKIKGKISQQTLGSPCLQALLAKCAKLRRWVGGCDDELNWIWLILYYLFQVCILWNILYIYASISYAESILLREHGHKESSFLFHDGWREKCVYARITQSTFM